VPRNGGLVQAQAPGQIADVPRAIPQFVQDQNPAGVGDRLADFGMELVNFAPQGILHVFSPNICFGE
jgi:hypothetical protein